MIDDISIAKKYVEKHKRASKGGIEFSLSFAEYKRMYSRKTCAYSGIEFTKYGTSWDDADRWRSLTIDRIDNKKGYITGNVVAVCNGVNNLKSQWENPNNPLSEDITKKIIKNIARYMK